ncbi:NAD(P)/FAD-dependent oxidoreductase [Spirulina sp. CS-785/01]|uniref:phytoene desaturase family protein n=1 Tax=Spirulina sp. CS-785/01 TaxID=3021716 RepID=UPI002330953B|nr:NAD(P)/FAD-dependent oxidoreductase [Spirulina sp. CS-785/01]MDB9313805.1 NAD(P)/FAD-dependent oxidoreductase [Spirulina sp. CS-785/01]
MVDAIVIGSGVGGLTAGALLARYGKKVLIVESHSIPGGAVHSFDFRGFHFDSGASFYCGIGPHSHSLNPLKLVLDRLGESLKTVPYDPLGYYHFPEGTMPIHCNLEQYQQAVAQFTPQGAKELKTFTHRLLSLYTALKDMPITELRSDWQMLPIFLQQYWAKLGQILAQLPLIQSSVGDIVEKTIQDPWVKRLIDIECFLLSGLNANGTIAPEVAFMLGERSRTPVEYPVGGSGAIAQALIRGLQRWGGELRLCSPVEKILVESGQVKGVRLRHGETLNAPIIISNATLWDTYSKLLNPQDLPQRYKTQQLKTPTVESFMHLHLGIDGTGLENLAGHHVVLLDGEQDITKPGNTCMISIPSVWDKTLAPHGYHTVHAYTLEPYQGWQRDARYQAKKKARVRPLYQALEKIIPDIRQRIKIELIGTPLTHERFLHRYQGTYGAAIPANQGMFPNCFTPISGLYRVGDSTLPGIGVPAVAASGLLCANTLVPPQQVRRSLEQ